MAASSLGNCCRDRLFHRARRLLHRSALDDGNRHRQRRARALTDWRRSANRLRARLGPSPLAARLVETAGDAVAEGWTRRGRIVRAHRGVHLRNHRRRDVRRRRRWRQRRIELRPAGRNEDLRRGGACEQQRRSDRADNDRCHVSWGICRAPPGEPQINYSSGAFSIGSKRSASSPSRFHDCSICGGSGA